MSDVNFNDCTNQIDLVIAILGKYGLRIGEVLSLRYERVIGDTIIFQGLKGSRDRFIRDSELVGALNRICGLQENGRVFTVNYGDIYRHLKGRDTGLNGRKKTRVTSSFRILFINSLKLKGLSRSDIREEIGHKKQETTDYYLQLINDWR